MSLSGICLVLPYEDFALDYHIGMFKNLFRCLNRGVQSSSPSRTIGGDKGTCVGDKGTCGGDKGEIGEFREESFGRRVSGIGTWVKLVDRKL